VYAPKPNFVNGKTRPFFLSLTSFTTTRTCQSASTGKMKEMFRRQRTAWYMWHADTRGFRGHARWYCSTNPPREYNIWRSWNPKSSVDAPGRVVAIRGPLAEIYTSGEAYLQPLNLTRHETRAPYAACFCCSWREGTGSR
jgi:hypothetical protein